MSRIKFLIDKISNDPQISNTCVIKIKQSAEKTFIKLKSTFNSLTIQLLQDDGNDLGVLVSDKLSAQYMECTVCCNNVLDYIHFKIVDSQEYFYQLFSYNTTVNQHYTIIQNVDNVLELRNDALDIIITRMVGIDIIYECIADSAKYHNRKIFEHVHEVYRYIMQVTQQQLGVQNG